jgi:hypothetical protein
MRENVRDITASRHGGNAESALAFRDIRPHLAEQTARVASIILQHPKGLTAQEIEGISGIPYNCVSARCAELKAHGFVLRKKLGTSLEGKPFYERRHTRSGSLAVVLIWNPAVNPSVIGWVKELFETEAGR